MIYHELHARSAFSFLRGASNPEDLACAAARLSLPSIALSDRDGVYGSPRLHAAAKEQGIRALVGAELTMEDKCILPVLVATRTGYQNLCRLVTNSRLRGSKTESTVLWNELPAYAEGLLALTGDEEGILQDPCHPQTSKRLEQLRTAFGNGNVLVEIQRHLRRGETWRNKQLVDLARGHKLPLVATNGVLYAEPDARRALDLFACARNHTTFDSAGRLLSINAERYLKSAAQMERLFADLPEAVENTVKIAERLEFYSREFRLRISKISGASRGNNGFLFAHGCLCRGAGPLFSSQRKGPQAIELRARLDRAARLLRLFSYCLGHCQLLHPE